MPDRVTGVRLQTLADSSASRVTGVRLQTLADSSASRVSGVRLQTLAGFSTERVSGVRLQTLAGFSTERITGVRLQILTGPPPPPPPTPQYNLLVFDEGAEPERNAYLAAQRSGRWFYDRNAIAGTVGGFFGFFFDGVSMIGLTGAPYAVARGLDVADFRGFLDSDPGPKQIECVYGSHYEDCGLPDNDKVWLEVVIDFECTGALVNNMALVYAGFNNGKIAPMYLGSIGVGPRQSVSFPFGALTGAMDAGYLARNVAILIDGQVIGQATIHNVYLYYYEEARLAVVASTLPTDLGVGKLKECKELQLDINAYSDVVATVVSDLPGNALGTVETLAIAPSTGRGVLKLPFATQEGFLWQVALAGGPFRLYGARLLMRVIGVFVEGYESEAGFVWDSMQIALAEGEVSTIDQLRFEMQTGGATSVKLFTDLPGEASFLRAAFPLTSGASGRAWVTIPIPAGVEARSAQVQVTGNSGYRIYRAQVRHARIGRYLAGFTPEGADAFNMLEFDFQSERVRMYKRFEIDLSIDNNGGTNGTVTLLILTEQSGSVATEYTATISTPLGRQTLLLPLPPGIRGRLFRVQLTTALHGAAARIYHMRVLTRPLSDLKAAWEWADVPLEASDILPSYGDFVVAETSPSWELVDIPFSVSES